MKRFALLGLILFFAACTAQPAASDADEARSTLVNFLTLLNTGKYEEAIPHYGGEYGALQVFNPQIDPGDHVGLWTWACDNRLLQCLAVRSAELEYQEGDTYVFQVEFSNPDGSQFVRGPCCGASETEMPPESQFEYTVVKTADGRFVVMNTPPYVP